MLEVIVCNIIVIFLRHSVYKVSRHWNLLRSISCENILCSLQCTTVPVCYTWRWPTRLGWCQQRRQWFVVFEMLLSWRPFAVFRSRRPLWLGAVITERRGCRITHCWDGGWASSVTSAAGTDRHGAGTRFCCRCLDTGIYLASTFTGILFPVDCFSDNFRKALNLSLAVSAIIRGNGRGMI